MKWILAALLVAFVALAAAAPPSKALSPTDEEELRKTAADLKEAILHQDVERILRHVSKSSGLMCTDTKISYQQIGRDLRNRNSHLYMSLFDSARFFKQCGSGYPVHYPAISEKEYFTTTTSESLGIVALGDGWAQVTLKSQTKGHYPRQWYFHKEGREWKLVEGFILSRCTCG